jgi:hypothetical protein
MKEKFTPPRILPNSTALKCDTTVGVDTMLRLTYG